MVDSSAVMVEALRVSISQPCVRCWGPMTSEVMTGGGWIAEGFTDLAWASLIWSKRSSTSESSGASPPAGNAAGAGTEGPEPPRADQVEAEAPENGLATSPGAACPGKPPLPAGAPPALTEPGMMKRLAAEEGAAGGDGVILEWSEATI